MKELPSGMSVLVETKTLVKQSVFDGNMLQTVSIYRHPTYFSLEISSKYPGGEPFYREVHTGSEKYIRARYRKLK